MIDISAMEVDLLALSGELTEANVEHRALGTRNGMLHTYDEGGNIAELPPEALPVVLAHIPPPPPLTKQEILLMLLDTVEPGAEDTEILWLVLKENLRND